MSNGPFEIVEQLGEGAYGHVVSAYPRPRMGSGLVALKILKPSLVNNESVMQSVRDEAAVLMSIRHKNVVRVDAIRTVAGAPVIVMEHVPGVCLETVLSGGEGGLPVSVTLALMDQLCQAVVALHSQTRDSKGHLMRVLHRDIKSANIMLSVDGVLKLVDFGTACSGSDTDSEPLSHVAMGSRAYMAPERFDGAVDTCAVDVYSMGILLAEMMTGQLLVLSLNQSRHGQLLERHLADALVDTDEATLSHLRMMVTRMCHYSPDRRASVSEVQTMLLSAWDRLAEDTIEPISSFGRRVIAPLYEAREIFVPVGLFPVLEETNRGDATSAQTQGKPKSRRMWWWLVPLVASLVFFATRSPTTTRVIVPPTATATVDGQLVTDDAGLVLVSGAHVLSLQFDGGALFECAFQSAGAGEVRYVVDDGYGAVSVNGQPPVRCEDR